MKRLTSFGLAGLLTILMVLSGTAAATAQTLRSVGPAHSADPSRSVIINDVNGLTDSVISKYDRYVSYSSGRGFVTAIPAAVVRSDPAGAASVRRSVAMSNATLERLTGAYQVSSSAGVVTVARGDLMSPAATRHGGITFSWWGITLWLDEYATNILVSGLAAGSGAAWVAAELTSWTGVGGLSGGAIAALLALGSAAIHLCDWNGRGVNFHLSYVGIGWCWAR